MAAKFVKVPVDSKDISVLTRIGNKYLRYRRAKKYQDFTDQGLLKKANEDYLRERANEEVKRAEERVRNPKPRRRFTPVRVEYQPMTPEQRAEIEQLLDELRQREERAQ